jgi:hypothetical protein
LARVGGGKVGGGCAYEVALADLFRAISYLLLKK